MIIAREVHVSARIVAKGMDLIRGALQAIEIGLQVLMESANLSSCVASSAQAHQCSTDGVGGVSVDATEDF